MMEAKQIQKKLIKWNNSILPDMCGSDEFTEPFKQNRFSMGIINVNKTSNCSSLTDKNISIRSWVRNRGVLNIYIISFSPPLLF